MRLFILLKRNIIPIIFFVLIGAGVFSFLDYRNERVDFVRSMVLYNREKRGRIQAEAQGIANLSLIASGNESEYNNIIKEFENLESLINESKNNIPTEELALVEYDDYLEDSEEYYEAYLTSVQRSRGLFKKKYEIQEEVQLFQNGEELTIQNIPKIVAVLDYLDAKSIAGEEETKSKNLRQLINDIQADGNVSEEEQQNYANQKKTNEIFIPEGFHLIQFTDIDNSEVFESFKSLESSENFLRAAFDLKSLD